MAIFVWSNVKGGNWSDDGNWTPAGVPGPADTALIVVAGQYAIGLDVAEIGSVTLDAAGVTLTPTGTLKLDGSLDVKAGTLAVSQTIRGGTLIADGGTINYIGGTLDGVTLSGALALGATNSVTIQDGITFSGAGPEQILVDGTLHLADNETLSNAAITLNGVIDTEHSDTLTLSGSTTLTGNGSLEGTTVNEGTITINGGGLVSGFEPMGSLNTALINEGTITLSGGAQARIENLFNSGTILLSGAGTTLTLPDDTPSFEFGNNQLSLADGATFVLNPSFVGAAYSLGSITFSGENNVLQLGGTSLGLHSSTFRGDLIGFVGGDQIDFQGTGFNVSYANGELDISNLSFVNRFELSGADYADAQFTLTVTNGGTILTTTADAPCFCTGTLILTDRGERPVESLSPGDRVVTRQDGAEATLTVRWVGRRRVRVGRHPEPDHVHPVHIRRDAIAPGQPSRDLWLSPDHAVVLDGMLIQARQLVNGVTILRDTGRRTVTYHHVELERHAVMLADGLPCESYLDTGNRAQFDDAAVVALHPAFGRADDPGACAPLVTEGDRIHPVWLAIAGRASRTGSLPDPRTTREAEPCLVLADGSVLQPGEIGADGRHVFWFDGPAMTGRVRLRSRCGTACDIRPWLDDRRRLGVAVGGLMAWIGHDDDEPGPLDLDGLPMADGWWATERDGTRTWRWTNGDAALDLPPGCRRLDVLVTGTAEYRLDQKPVPRAA